MWAANSWVNTLWWNESKKRIATTRLERLLQLNVATLTALGAVLLGTGQMSAHSVLLSVLAVLAAVSSVIFTDMLGWFRLNRTLANLAAIMAVGFSLTDFFGNDAEYQLLAVANLLVYLQIVLLFQEKNERIYWQLMILSLLQVVVSAALNLGFQFGVLVVLYMFAAFAAMGLFFFHRESSRFFAPDSDRATGGARRRRRQSSSRAAARPLTFRLRADLTEVLGGRRLLRQVISMGFTTLLFTVMFFFALPRVSDQVWQGPRRLMRSMVGFSQEVTLGEMTKMLQSEEEVMRVSFFDEQTGEAVRFRIPPYLRGTDLVPSLGSNEGRWRPMELTKRNRGVPVGQASSSRGRVVRQEITLQKQADPVLFAVFPVCEVAQTPSNVRVDPTSQQLFRDDYYDTRRGMFEYALGTNGIENGQQLPVHPVRRRYLPGEKLTMRKFDYERWSNLNRIADEVVAAAGVSNTDVYGQARALEAHFHEPGLYTYSLNQLGVERNPDLAPVEDFVTNHRTGHCEYFASALVLMLRSRGIPARMVVGYRATEYNSLGNFYQVREKEAHAWAEAFLEYNEVPAELRERAGIDFNGAWLRLEPTPIGGADDAQDAALTIWDQIIEWKNYSQRLWSDYILGLNARRQRESIYKPVVDFATQAIATLRDPHTWQQLAEAYVAWIRDRLALFVAATFVLIVAVAWGGWQFWRRIRRDTADSPAPSDPWWRRRSRRSHGSRRRVRVEFYEQLEALLARYGIRRPRHETQREFADDAAGRLRSMPRARHAAGLPARIVEVFYRVRFGNRGLEAADSRQMEHAISELSQALAAQQKSQSAE
jgi:transglutaminase-like putative cysteine protease